MLTKNARQLASDIIESVTAFERPTDRARTVIDTLYEFFARLALAAEREIKFPTLHKRGKDEPLEMLNGVCTKPAYAKRFVEAIEKHSLEKARDTIVTILKELLEPVAQAFSKIKTRAGEKFARILRGLFEPIPA